MDTSKMNVDEEASMYLSFNSTMSASAYKTFEATQYAMDQDGDCDHKNNTVSDDSHDLHMESTLEADNTMPEQLQTAKKAAEMSLQVLTALPKNMLPNYNAMSSTPAKNEAVFKPEGNMQYVEIERSFGEAFDFKLLDEHDKGEKENVVPPANDGTTGIAITEQPVAKTPRKLTEDAKVLSVEPVPKQQHLADEKLCARTPIKNKSLVYVKPGITNSKNTPIDIKKAEKAPLILPKPKPDLQPIKNSRKSVCEPDLKTNRPSRIVPNRMSSTAKELYPCATAAPSSSKVVVPLTAASSSKVAVLSTAPSFVSKTSKGLIPVTKSALGPSTSKGTISLTEAQFALPQLLSKMAKVTFEEQKPIELVNVKDESCGAGNFIPRIKNLQIGNKRKSLLPMVAAAEKRQSFAQRMSTVVKTTLNSPARKIPRKSLLPSKCAQPRRSVAVVKTDHKPSRMSMMPSTSSVAANKAATGSKTSQLPTRRTLLPNTGTQQKIPVSKQLVQSHVCTDCGCTFSLKSLLNAHKRSHEDGSTPPFVRKTQSGCTETAATGLLNPSNKCKFCDKKFALLRALHIHLMQNCPKIPPAEKRKLHFTEMDHVEKAQLPHVFNASHTGSVCKTISNPSATSKMPQKSLSNLGTCTAPVISKPLLLEQKEAPNKNRMADEVEMPPPQRGLATKSNGQPSGRQNGAHRGVFRTPNKAITCYICKTQFKTVLEYTNHSLEMHSSSN